MADDDGGYFLHEGQASRSYSAADPDDDFLGRCVDEWEECSTTNKQVEPELHATTIEIDSVINKKGSKSLGVKDEWHENQFEPIGVVDHEDDDASSLKQHASRYWGELLAWKQLDVAVYSSVMFLTLSLLVYFGTYAATVDGESADWIDCFSSEYIFGPRCGMNGVGCLPFESPDRIAFRCPRGCTWDENPDLRVYGSGPYNANSRICKAAIHAGIIGTNGGCGVYRLTGALSEALGSTANGVDSLSFLFSFPKNFEFLTDFSSSSCTDLAWPILLVWYLFLLGFAYFPHVSPKVLFFTLGLYGYAYVAFIGQPVDKLPSAKTYAFRLSDSIILSALLNQLYSMLRLESSFEKWSTQSRLQRFLHWGIIYLIPYIIALNLNLIANVPALNADLGGFGENSENYNGWTVVILIVLGIAALAVIVWHAFQFYRLKTLKKYSLRTFLAVTLFLLLWLPFIPSFRIHLHHANVGILLIIIARMDAVPSKIVAAVGLALFVQGYAAFGWDPFLEPAPGKRSIPIFLPPTFGGETTSSATVLWEAFDNVPIYSLSLNGVERYRGIDSNFTLENLEPGTAYFSQVRGISRSAVGAESDPSVFLTAGGESTVIPSPPEV